MGEMDGRRDEEDEGCVGPPAVQSSCTLLPPFPLSTLLHRPLQHTRRATLTFSNLLHTVFTVSRGGGVLSSDQLIFSSTPLKI